MYLVNMKINTAIRELWKNGFFLEHRKPSDVKNKLFNEYQITSSNVLMQLKSCKKFLRQEDKGWIQKKNARVSYSKLYHKNQYASQETLYEEISTRYPRQITLV